MEAGSQAVGAFVAFLRSTGMASTIASIAVVDTSVAAAFARRTSFVASSSAMGH